MGRNRIVILYVALAILWGAAVNAGSDYLWPTKGIPVQLTSVMCDKRNNHPHAGIDLGLHGKVGVVPIVSVDDGVLMRIRSSRHGYGNAVYVRMPDKHVAVYAHLDRFSPRLNKIAESIRRRTGQKKLDYYFEEWELSTPIRRGEIIGFGGNTGTSSAHLHFELRYDDAINLNPLTNGFPVADTVAPTINALQLVPVDPDALVRGKSAPVVLRVGKGGQVVGAASPVDVSRRVGLSVSAQDRAKPGGRRFSPYRIALRVDGAPFFETRYEKWSWFDTRLVDEQYDMSAARKLFMRVYNPFPTDIPFFSAADAGTFDALPPGPHEVEIVVADAAGNQSTATLAINVVDDGQKATRPWPYGKGEHELFNKATVAAGEKRFFVDGLADSFFAPLRIDVTPAGSNDDRVIGDCYRLSDPGLMARRGFRLRFSLADQAEPTRQLGVYQRTSAGLTWVTQDREPWPGFAAARTKDFATYCLVRDATPPTIGRIGNGGGRDLVSFVVADDLSGLAVDAVKVYVDGKLALAGFDQRTGQGGAEVYWPLAPGAHEVRIVAVDRSGNEAERTVSRKSR